MMAVAIVNTEEDLLRHYEEAGQVWLVVIGGDVAYTFDELGSGATEGQRRVLA